MAGRECRVDTMSSPTIIRVTEEELNINDILARLTRKTVGAVVIFTGIVRGETDVGTIHETVSLEYDAYQSMAEKKMKQIAVAIRKKWPMVQGIAIVQRIGQLFPGMPAVIIACTSAHRNAGIFEAASYGIDRMKEIVPVWKKEIGILGEEWVEGGYIPQRGD